MGSWRSESITEKQKAYINDMREFSPFNLPLFNGTTKGEAHDYIEKYKNLANQNIWALENGYC